MWNILQSNDLVLLALAPAISPTRDDEVTERSQLVESTSGLEYLFLV